MSTLQPQAPGYIPGVQLSDVRQHLAKLRKDRGFSQDEVAEDAGVGQATVSRLEDLKTEMSEIEFETIRKIVENGLSISLSEFFRQIESLSDGRASATQAHASAPKGIPKSASSSRDPVSAQIVADLCVEVAEVFADTALRLGVSDLKVTKSRSGGARVRGSARKNSR